MCSTHTLPMLSIVGAVVNERGGQIATGRHGGEEEDGHGGADTDGRNDDWVVAHDVADGRFGGLIGKKVGGSVMLVADFDSDGAADDNQATDEVAGSKASAVGDQMMVEPGENQAMVEVVGGLETVALCDSSQEMEKEADALANGIHVLANGGGVLASAAAKFEAGDLESVFAANSGFALGENDSWLIWISLCRIFLWWCHCWASLDCNRTRGHGNRQSLRQNMYKCSNKEPVPLYVTLATSCGEARGSSLESELST